MEKMIISKSFREKIGNNVRTCSMIKSDKEDYKLWFEIENKYENYISDECEDAFLIAILPYAIKKELDIEIEGKISERLYYQITTYLIPMLCRAFNKRIINVETDIDNNCYNTQNAVGTGISCGVDSLYTIQKHYNRINKNYNVTHLTFFNAGSNGEYGGEKARKFYQDRIRLSRKFAEENDLSFVMVDSNMNEFLMMNHKKTHTFRSLACALVLQKLFAKYYYSSGYEFDNSKIDESDTAHYDILIMQCLSTENITFYSTGLETNRIGKVKEIAKFKPSYKYLNVCLKEDYNCGECEKCKRTLLELDAIGKLESYKEVFDINKFEKNKKKNIIFLLRKRRMKDIPYIEIYNEYKKNKTRIPIYLRIISLFPTKEYCKYIIFKIVPKEKLKKILRVDKRSNKIKDGWMN